LTEREQLSLSNGARKRSPCLAEQECPVTIAGIADRFKREIF
jgi:hypothetical protein